MINLTKIYFVRHCEAMGNLNRTFQGSTDNDITDFGEKQLEKLSERFSNIPLDKIYTSPLLRARKTALAIQGARDIAIEALSGIVELNGGIIENKPVAESFAKFPEYKDAWFNHPEDFAPENGEAMRDAYKRIEKAFFELVEKHKGETIACASHGGIIRCLECRILYNDITKLKDVTIFENTAILLLEIDDNGIITVKFSNDFSHLTPELIRHNVSILRAKKGGGLK